jgi:hypothetical protein
MDATPLRRLDSLDVALERVHTHDGSCAGLERILLVSGVEQDVGRKVLGAGQNVSRLAAKLHPQVRAGQVFLSVQCIEQSRSLWVVQVRCLPPPHDD